MDIPDIEVVVQWRVTCNLDTLWQRFGRAARGQGTTALAVLLAESKYFDDEIATARKRVKKRGEAKKRNAQEKELGKRQRGMDGRRGAAAKRARADGPGMEPNVLESDSDNSDDPSVSDGPNNYNSTDELFQEAPDEQMDLDRGGDLSVCESLRVLFCQARLVIKSKGKWKGKRSADELEAPIAPELDNLINAASRSFKCYRKVIMAYYENDRIGKSDAHWLRFRKLPLTLHNSSRQLRSPRLFPLPGPSIRRLLFPLFSQPSAIRHTPSPCHSSHTTEGWTNSRFNR